MKWSKGRDVVVVEDEGEGEGQKGGRKRPGDVARPDERFVCTTRGDWESAAYWKRYNN